jgi:hypothetical protein
VNRLCGVVVLVSTSLVFMIILLTQECYNSVCDDASYFSHIMMDSRVLDDGVLVKSHQIVCFLCLYNT